jgi:hypothetical protein
MEQTRSYSTPAGRAMAESLKGQGKTLNQMIGEKTVEIFGTDAIFDGLSEVQKNQVYEGVVTAAGTARYSRLAVGITTVAGHTLFMISIAISIYNIATADDKIEATKREGTLTAAGIGGGVLGGAAGGFIAGLACGPGAPVCVPVTVFVGAVAGGALTVWGASHIFGW